MIVFLRYLRGLLLKNSAPSAGERIRTSTSAGGHQNLKRPANRRFYALFPRAKSIVCVHHSFANRCT